MVDFGCRAAIVSPAGCGRGFRWGPNTNASANATVLLACICCGAMLTGYCNETMLVYNDGHVFRRSSSVTCGGIGNAHAPAREDPAAVKPHTPRRDARQPVVARGVHRILSTVLAESVAHLAFARAV